LAPRFEYDRPFAARYGGPEPVVQARIEAMVGPDAAWDRPEHEQVRPGVAGEAPLVGAIRSPAGEMRELRIRRGLKDSGHSGFKVRPVEQCGMGADAP
jgi:hypothetical protein